MNHHRLFVIALGYGAVFLSSPVFGQKPTPRPSHDETKAVEKSPAATPPPSSPCTPVVDVCDIIKQYAALTNFRVIRDNFVQGKMFLDVSGLPPEEAIDTIERTLFANNYALVQIDSETVEIVGTGKNPRTEGAQIITNPKDLPHGERVVAYLFKPSFRDVLELQQSLGQYLQPPQVYTSLLAFPKANALLITERSSVVRSLIEIVAAIDAADTTKKP